MVVGALIVTHVENFSDEKAIPAILETPYMQYLLGLPKFSAPQGYLAKII